MFVKVYVCHAMTGRRGKDLIAEAEAVKQAAMQVSKNIILLDPIIAENVPDTKETLNNPIDLLAGYWARDKQMIREAHVVLDATGPLKSAGVEHEIGFSRYCLWKPVVRVWPGLGASVARLEDDAIVDNYMLGFKLIERRWGDRAKRVLWRLSMLKRCLPRWILDQIKAFD